LEQDKDLITLISYDGGSRIPGARMGPTRLMDWTISRYPFIKNDYCFNELVFNNSPFDLVFKKIYDTLSEKVNKYERQIVIGGDHSISAPLIHMFVSKNKLVKKKLVIFDAHIDAFEDGTRIIKNWNFINYIVNEIDELLIVGPRDVLKPNYLPNKIKVISTLYMRQFSEKATKKIKIFCSDKNAEYYLSIDMDSINPSEFPGVSYPIAGGISYNLISQLIKSIIEKTDPKFIDLMEFNPLIEQSMSANALFFLFYSIITTKPKERREFK
jgi:arginase family enzyme